MKYQHIPKAELHLHLEGAAPPDFIRQLAHEKRLDLSGIFSDDGGYAYRDFDHFLQVYEAACTTLTGPQEFYRLTRAVLEQSAAQNVVYTEAFISPDFCGGGDVAAWRDYLAAIETAAAECEAEFGITLRAIVTCVRHMGPEQSKASARCAAETAGRFVTGFGMGGAEMLHQPKDFAWAFDCAAEAGLGLTCHAGEWGGAQMVSDTIRDLNVTRIGHGIHAIQDPNLVKEIVEKQIVLEVCPGSNVFLQAVPDWASHPIQALRDAGVLLTVSTDDPPFFRTTMDLEYQGLAQHFGWSEPDFRMLNEVALGAAFCDEETRATLAKRLEIPQ